MIWPIFLQLLLFLGYTFEVSKKFSVGDLTFWISSYLWNDIVTKLKTKIEPWFLGCNETTHNKNVKFEYYGSVTASDNCFQFMFRMQNKIKISGLIKLNRNAGYYKYNYIQI